MTTSRTRALLRLPAVGVPAGAAVLLLAGSASAHVTVSPTSAPKGSYSTVSFKVPNEEESADTTKVQVFFPAGEPLASVETEPVPGWTASVSKVRLARPITTDDGQVTEAVSSITWSGGRIRPGQFEQFPVSLGPLPTNASSLAFKALQTYGGDQVVRWIDLARPGAAEPAHPAPTLTLTAADGATDASPAAATGASASASPPGGSDTTARILGIFGIVIGVVGAGYGVLAGRRRKETGTP